MGDGTAKAVGLSLAEQVEGVLMRDLPEAPNDEHGPWLLRIHPSPYR
jgi:hypothetical protein